MLHYLEEHDIHGLENSLFGKAKSDPVKFCGLLHTQIEELEVHPSTFNEEGSQWYQRMLELFDAMKILNLMTHNHYQR